MILFLTLLQVKPISGVNNQQKEKGKIVKGLNLHNILTVHLFHANNYILSLGVENVYAEI